MSDDDHRIIHVDSRPAGMTSCWTTWRVGAPGRGALAGEVAEDGGDEALGQLGQTLITLGAGIVAQVEGRDELGQLLKDLAIALQLEEARQELRGCFLMTKTTKTLSLFMAAALLMTALAVAAQAQDCKRRTGDVGPDQGPLGQGQRQRPSGGGRPRGVAARRHPGPHALQHHARKVQGPVAALGTDRQRQGQRR